MELQGQTAMVSGGLGDLGRAIALELSSRGANVSIGDLRAPGEADGFLARLRETGVGSVYEQVDLREPEAVSAWVERTEAELGTPTLIVSNAGIVTRASVLEIEPEQWSNEFAVNVGGALSLCQAAAKRMIARSLPGRIVLVGSWAAHRPNRAIPAYCASKAALRMLGQLLAAELAPRGILVNEVAPGAVNAGLSAANVRGMTPETLASKIPTGTWIEPEEVAWHVAGLCSPRNANMAGNVVVVDGGLSLTNKWN